VSGALLGKPGPLGRALRAVSPNAVYGATIVQLFLHEPGRTTTATFTNVASLYAPQDAVGCRYELTLFGETGARVGSIEVDVAPYGTVELNLAERLPGTLPRHGILVARLRSAPRLHRGAKHLGAIVPHFYVLYHAPDRGSLALVHPQTGLVEHPAPDQRWTSNLRYDPAPLAALEACQINPTAGPARSTVELWCGDERLDAREAELAPMASRQVRFGRDVLDRATGPVHVAVDGMTAPNAKPLLFQHLPDGGFAGSHG
jgi:hypothetical protein